MKTLWINWCTKEIWRKMEADGKWQTRENTDSWACWPAVGHCWLTCSSLQCPGKPGRAGGAPPAAHPALWLEGAEPHRQHLQHCYFSTAKWVVRGETYQVSCDTWTPRDKSLITFNDVGCWGRERRPCGAWCHRATEAGNFKMDLHGDCWLNQMTTRIEWYDTLPSLTRTPIFQLWFCGSLLTLQFYINGI